MKQLIVNADDLGRSSSINQGILEAHRKGIVTSTTVMINLPDAPSALELMAAQAPNLGVGLHINMTYGSPVAPAGEVASLLNNSGQFLNINQWAAHYEQFEPAHLQREITAQFERFVSLAGRVPDHMDSHHHAAYLHPAALQTMLTLAADHALPLRHLDLEDAEEPPHGLDKRVLGDLQAVLDENPSPFWPARFEMSFFGSKATLGNLLVILTNLPENTVTELMCHPGYHDAATTDSSYGQQRETEVEHLTHAATRECVQAEAIQLIRFGDLTR